MDCRITSISFPREVRERILIKCEYNWNIIGSIAILYLMFDLVQCWHVVSSFHFIASSSSHAKFAGTSSGLAVTDGSSTNVVVGATNITVTGVTSDHVISREVEEAIVALVTDSGTTYNWFTVTLSIKLIANTNASDCSCPVAFTVTTALRIIFLHVVEERLAGVTLPSHDPLLAGAEFTRSHVGAATPVKEVFWDTLRVAVTLFTDREVKPIRLTSLTFVSFEVGLACALAGVVARFPNGTIMFTIAFCM